MQPTNSLLQQYLIITGNYWAFTLTDGALRMLVVLHFHQLGYSALSIAMMFLFYEIFGVITNLVGGWLGAHIGLNRTMNIGLALQVVALGFLLVPDSMLSVVWVMVAQALSGIAKDLNKMSAKSSIKLLVPKDAQTTLYRWVAILTGSKNALKGCGFFLGGLLLSILGFQGAALAMAIALAVIWILSLWLLAEDLGKAKSKPKFSHLFSSSKAINILSAARCFLFGARDVWFVVALPVMFAAQLGWEHHQIGAFFASWIIGYGFIQAATPMLTGSKQGKSPARKDALGWILMLSTITGLLAYAVSLPLSIDQLTMVIIGGLLLFGVAFAVNSAMHSYLIVSLAKDDGVSVDVGFYYMANAMGRLLGTVLSGWLYQSSGFTACLWTSFGMLVIASGFTFILPALADKQDNGQCGSC